jgi:phosphatidylserine decarboxylase
MSTLLQNEPLFRLYPYLPHRALNGAAGLVARARWPRPIVDAAVSGWIRSAGIDMRDFETGPCSTIHDFFLRRLRPGARPLGAGFVAPVDGRVVAAGRIARGEPMVVKGHELSVERVVNGTLHDRPMEAYDGGAFVTLFLSPEGYHRIHMPVDAEVVDCRWIPGRFFPQNERALASIHGVYERNERAVLGCRAAAGYEFLLVLVGASLVGGIHLEGIERRAWVRRGAVTLGRRFAKGEEIGHFAFGSTVIVLWPRGVLGRPAVRPGERVLLGRTLWEPAHA